MSNADALREKELGNAAYKKREFDTAAAHYEKAYSLEPSIVYLNNLAAVEFERGQLDKCIEVCQRAVDEGREARADYKLIAKAFARIGAAYGKKSDFDNSLKFYNKSLSEHRDPAVLLKVKEIERSKAEAERLAYIDPALSDKARDEGNTLFKSGDFAGSVKLYTEAIKRNPDDARGYTNRAAAYTKLLALSEALKDAESAIKADPTFVKGYIRKSHVKFAMREYDAAATAIEAARAADTAGKNTSEINAQARKIMEAQYGQQANETDEERMARASRDPEVLKIMQDPVMQSILQQAQADPRALQEHLKNPDIRSKIMKLVQAGIVKTGPGP